METFVILYLMCLAVFPRPHSSAPFVPAIGPNRMARID
jgi:hypothetical protein